MTLQCEQTKRVQDFRVGIPDEVAHGSDRSGNSQVGNRKGETRHCRVREEEMMSK